MSEYLYGMSARLGNTFTDSSGTVYDPDTISLTIYDAEGTSKKVVTYAAAEIEKTSTGIYFYDYLIPADSTVQGYWIGVWTVVSIGRSVFIRDGRGVWRCTTSILGSNDLKILFIQWP